MTDQFTTNEALDKLSELLAAQTELATQQAEANRLKIEELRLQATEAENEARRLDLEAQGLDLERKRINRAEARLQEVIQRYSTASNQLITLDDAFGETVQRVIERMRAIEDSQRDIEKGLYALLSQSLAEIQDSFDTVKRRMIKGQLQGVITQHYENLQKLEERAARRGDDVPVSLSNQIDTEKEKIEELETRLKVLK